MTTLLVITQTTAAILLGAVGLFPSLQRPGGGLNRAGYVLFGIGVVVFLVSTVSIQRLTAAEAEATQHRMEELLERYFSATAERVMSTPRGPVIPPAPPAPDVIHIDTPSDGSEVEPRHLVEGTVSDPTKAVWVVVHPMDTSSYWVQPQVSVRAGGAWSVTAYFGRSGDLDSGKRFEVLAIAGPSDALREADNLASWPKAKWMSQVVTVIRR